MLNFNFLKNGSNDFHKVLWIYCTFKPQEYGTIGKILATRKSFLIFYASPDVAPKPTDQSCPNSIFRVLLQLSPASPFHFRPSLNVKGSSPKKQETN